VRLRSLQASVDTVLALALALASQACLHRTRAFDFVVLVLALALASQACLHRTRAFDFVVLVLALVF